MQAAPGLGNTDSPDSDLRQARHGRASATVLPWDPRPSAGAAARRGRDSESKAFRLRARPHCGTSGARSPGLQGPCPASSIGGELATR